jgi:hypothetical protein
VPSSPLAAAATVPVAATLAVAVVDLVMADADATRLAGAALGDVLGLGNVPITTAPMATTNATAPNAPASITARRRVSTALLVRRIWMGVLLGI